jgi:hypothetical protein
MKNILLKKAWSKVRWTMCSVALVVMMAACSDDFLEGQQDTAAVAYVSFYHASPDAPGLSVTVDNRSVFNKIEYTEYSGYLNFYTGNRNFKINSFNATNSLVDTTFSFDRAKTYSVFLIDQLSGIEALLVEDSANAPAAGKAMVRFVHLSPDAAALDVKFDGQTGDPLFGDQTFREASAFKEIAAGTTAFDVKIAGSDDVLLSADNLHFQAGRYYTIITRGFANPPQGNTNVLSVQVIEND